MSVSIPPSSDEAVQPFVVGTIGRVFVVRYRGEITARAMSEVFAAMIAARRNIGAPIVAVSIVPAHIDGPPRRGNETTENRFEVVERLCEAMYVSFEGQSLSRRIFRGLVGLRALTMKIELKSFEHGREAIECAARRVGCDPVEFAREAHERGLLDDDSAA